MKPIFRSRIFIPITGLIVLIPLFLCGQTDSSQRLKINKQAPTDTVTWVKSKIPALTGNLKSKGKTFSLLNGDSQTVKFANVKDADELFFDVTSGNYYKVRNKRQLAEGNRVMAWHPYWMTEELKGYQYEYLTDVIYFAYDVNPINGSYSDENAVTTWLTTPLCDSASKFKCNILLCATSYGEPNNNQFLANEESRILFCDSIRYLLNQRKAHGVDLDFTEISAAQAINFTKLVKALRQKLGDSMLIYVHIPATLNARKNIQISELIKGEKPTVDLFILNGYDYESISKKQPVPMTTIKGLNELYSWCKERGVDSTRLVLNMPLYGTSWELNKAKEWEAKEIAYEDIIAGYVTDKKYIDVLTGSTFLASRKSLLWFESGESLDLKMGWARDKGLKGVGLWGLGYAGKNSDVWEAILNNFASSRYTAITPISIDNGKIYNLFHAIRERRKTLGYSLLIIVFMFIVATLLALLDWRIREIFFRNYIYRAILTGISLVLLVSGISWVTDESGGVATFFYGMLAGGAIMYLISKMYMQYRKKMP